MTTVRARTVVPAAVGLLSARGAAFDLKAWHMAALSQGSLGLDDLAAELAVL